MAKLPLKRYTCIVEDKFTKQRFKVDIVAKHQVSAGNILKRQNSHLKIIKWVSWEFYE